jgi:hypothetical protein
MCYDRCVTIAVLLSLCNYRWVTIVVLLSLCYYRCVTIVVLLSLCYYRCVTLVVLLSLRYYRFVTIIVLRSLCYYLCYYRCVTIVVLLSLCYYRCATLVVLLSLRYYRCVTIIVLRSLCYYRCVTIVVWPQANLQTLFSSSSPVLSSSIQFYPVLSSSIQFYPVLSSSDVQLKQKMTNSALTGPPWGERKVGFSWSHSRFRASQKNDKLEASNKMSNPGSGSTGFTFPDGAVRTPSLVPCRLGDKKKHNSPNSKERARGFLRLRPGR